MTWETKTAQRVKSVLIKRTKFMAPFFTFRCLSNMLVANVLWGEEHTAFVALADRQEYAFTTSYTLYVQKATSATHFFYIDAKQQLTKRGYSVVSIIFLIKKPQKTRKNVILNVL